MSGSMNRVILVGNLGRDPEVRVMQSGDKVANLAIATSERWRDAQGNQQERTEWHRVVIFGKVAEVAESYVRKGAKVLIEGQLQTRKWQDQSGQDRYSTEVVVRGFSGRMTMLDGRRDGAGGGPAGTGAGGAMYGDGGTAGTGGEASGGAAGGGSYRQDDLDDEIPF